uniref:E3 ubiquitin-protein ligase n=1 Tax=Sinocyclocheilus rhinocerous TaxID=307959 RepID=A0A673J7D3_9TELE
MPDYGPGAVGGAVQDEGVKFRGQGKADAGFNEESKDNSRHESKGAHAEEETCTICMDSFTNKTKLKCGHEFCQECIRMSVESLGSICPVCKEESFQIYKTMRTPEPAQQSFYKSLSAEDCAYVNPGACLHGGPRLAKIDTAGTHVLDGHPVFLTSLIFTVGTSTTSGLESAVTWNDIHHKINTHGGPLKYGYPDPDYLKRVKDELKAKGIE